MRRLHLLSLVIAATVILSACGSVASARERYLLYTVNPGEGFNLARDVYIRVASLMMKLKADDANTTWTLVLPPWTNPHWRGEDRDANWSKFFDLEALRKVTNVIELDEFIARFGEGPVIDDVLHLQAPRWDQGEPFVWDPSVKPTECYFGTYPGTQYVEQEDGTWRGRFWGRGNRIWAKRLHCFRVMGDAHIIFDSLVNGIEGDRILIARFETMTNVEEHGRDYWRIRRNMRFAPALYEEAARFSREVIQKPYVAAHVRRSDFLYARKDSMATISDVAEQITALAEAHKTKRVFIASDARPDDEEFKALAKSGLRIFRYPGGKGVNNHIPSGFQFSEGQRAIIDQILCSEAKAFIGTRDSTFTYRINEERDLLKKPTASTYNAFCRKTANDAGVLGYHCDKPPKWTRDDIVHAKDEL